MSADKRDILAILKSELSFLEQGGYAQRTGHSWRPSLVFEDSPSCINCNDPLYSHACRDCGLIQLVPEGKRMEFRPCRHIPLTDDGRTINDFYRTGTERELEWALMVWLRKTIRKMEDDRGKLGDQCRRGCTDCKCDVGTA